MGTGSGGPEVRDQMGLGPNESQTYINLNFSSFLTEGPAQATSVKQSYVLDEILYSLIFTYRTRATITRS